MSGKLEFCLKILIVILTIHFGVNLIEVHMPWNMRSDTEKFFIYCNLLLLIPPMHYLFDTLAKREDKELSTKAKLQHPTIFVIASPITGIVLAYVFPNAFAYESFWELTLVGSGMLIFSVLVIDHLKTILHL